MEFRTKGLIMNLMNDIIESVKARETLLFIETIEEEETIGMLKNISKVLGRALVSWDSINQYQDITPENVALLRPPMESINALSSMLKEIRESKSDVLYVLKDISFYAHDNQDRQQLGHLVRNFKQLKISLKDARSSRKTIIIIGSCFNLTKELEDDFSIFYFKRPDKNQLKEIFISFIADNNLSKYSTNNMDVIEEIITAGKGLTTDQFRSCISKSVIRHGMIDNKTVDLVLEVKKQIIKKNGILEYIEESVDMNAVGGLTHLKEWLKKRKKGFSEQARIKGLPEPKGLLVFGVPGTGKSLSAKAVSIMWGRPIIRFDMGRIFGSFVGESEKNMREALRMAEAVAPCIMWIDEIEKGFAGSSGGHETTLRVLGQFLTWMQEKKESVFVIATANDVTALPAEFLRKGRFDEMFFVNVPNQKERKEIYQIHLRKYKLDSSKYDLDNLSRQSDNYTGAEIEQSIIEAGYNAFFEDRAVTQVDLQKNLFSTTPVYSTFKEKMDSDSYKKVMKMAKEASEKDEVN